MQVVFLDKKRTNAKQKPPPPPPYHIAINIAIAVANVIPSRCTTVFTTGLRECVRSTNTGTTRSLSVSRESVPLITRHPTTIYGTRTPAPPPPLLLRVINLSVISHRRRRQGHVVYVTKCIRGGRGQTTINNISSIHGEPN